MQVNFSSQYSTFMILLTCDHPKRELRSLKKLKKKLEQKNIKCKIINKALIIKAYNLYKPKLITIPHSLKYLIHPINVLKNKVKIIVIPTESCIMVDKFIKMQYCNIFSNHKKPSNHKKVDYFFTQSNYTSSFLGKSNLIKKKNTIATGYLYFDYWYENKKNIKVKNTNNKKIGIALTNELPLRFYNSRNFVKNFKKSHQDTDYYQNKWRLGQFNLDLIYLSIVFKIIEKLPKDYTINIRAHPLDSQTKLNEVFEENSNVVVDNNSKIQEWIKDQDIVVSTFSSIYIDSYIFKKPHVSLINLIPESFLKFKAYDSHSYKDHYEFYSNKPKNFDSLLSLIKKIKFKRSKKFDNKIFKYYNYPNKTEPIKNISENLVKIYSKTSFVYKEVIFSNIQKFMINFFGLKISSFLMFYLSEIKLYFHPHTNKSYYSMFTYNVMKMPYLLYKIIKK